MNLSRINRVLSSNFLKRVFPRSQSTMKTEKRKIEETEVEAEVETKILKENPPKEKKTRKVIRPGFGEEKYSETEYYFENGLRKVHPYNFTFTSYTKGRWVGEQIGSIFRREFRAQPPAFYERAIRNGKITVNGKKVEPEYLLQHNDLLANVVHRHEVPVTAEPITVLESNEDFLVINKPSSIPVHPCGRYRHNTVAFILAKEFDMKDVKTLHRLDRLTSGLLLFAKSTDKARQIEEQIREREVEKEYLCKVEGVFPDESIECKEPIEVVSKKIGVCRVSPKGKDCLTKFEKLSSDGETSIVLCKPRTGRMHQIRVHLQFLGYPIVDDPLYNHTVFGPSKGKGGDIGDKTNDQLIQELIKIHTAENFIALDSTEGIDMNEVEETNTESDCYECTQTYTDPKPSQLHMFLHAYKYSVSFLELSLRFSITNFIFLGKRLVF
ncbi:RPUSD2 family protein [Megaselia abdita]